MTDTVLLQLWHKGKLHDESEVDLNGDLMTWMDDAVEMLQDAITSLEPGENFTLIADRL